MKVTLISNQNEIYTQNQEGYKLTLESDNIYCESQFALVLQLILSLISERLEKRDYETVKVKMQKTFQEKVGVIIIKIFLNHNEMLNQKNLHHNTQQSKFINERILEFIGWSKEITIIQHPCYDYIEFSLIQSLVNFQEQILY